MKRCPQCRRDYFDETLLYCLDDGEHLVDGPASEEPATAIQAGHASEAPTKFISDELGGKIDRQPALAKSPLIFAAVGILLVAALGIGGYYYYGRGNGRSIDSIAVMPFTNESGSADNEYLSDGLTDTLIGSLSQIPDIKVKARSSVFRYKGKDMPMRDVGRELGVDAILNGRVVQRGTELTLYVELVDANSENNLWQQTYNKVTANLAALQNEIARDVANKLQVRLTGADEKRLARTGTQNAEANRLYLLGRFHLNKRTKTDVRKGIEYFDRAVALDPDYALAYTGLSEAYRILGGYDVSVDRKQAVVRGREYAMKALSLNDSISETHLAVGLILQTADYDFPGAERAIRRAIELDPNNAAAYASLGFLSMSLGRFDEAEANYLRAIELEPVSLNYQRGYGGFLMLARRYDESMAQHKKTIELDPNFVLAHLSLSNIYQLQGRYSEAVDCYIRSREILGADASARAAMRASYDQGGWKAFIHEMDRNAWFEEMRPRFIKAAQYVTTGERERALTELEKAYEERDGFMPLIKIDPRLDSLRDDPRYAALVKKIGL